MGLPWNPEKITVLRARYRAGVVEVLHRPVPDVVVVAVDPVPPDERAGVGGQHGAGHSAPSAVCSRIHSLKVRIPSIEFFSA